MTASRWSSRIVLPAGKHRGHTGEPAALSRAMVFAVFSAVMLSIRLSGTLVIIFVGLLLHGKLA